ncbi:hypothetical protein AAC387_Pa02g0950 [Persea americana]
MCQSATVFQLDGRIKTTLSKKISLSALGFLRGRRHSGNSDGHLPHPFPGNGNRSEASSWSMAPPPVSPRWDYPSLIPSGREKPSTVAIVLIIVSLVILLVIISCLVRFYIKRGCSSRSPVVAPLPEVELA